MTTLKTDDSMHAQYTVYVWENVKMWMWKNSFEKVALLQMEKIIRMFIENVFNSAFTPQLSMLNSERKLSSAY